MHPSYGWRVCTGCVRLTKHIRIIPQYPDSETMHAGVECGIMAAKIDDLDCVSFGPDIIDIHTVKEKLDIASTQRIWKLILNVLKQLS